MVCHCDPSEVDGHAYVQWIGTYFGDCVYSSVDVAGWALGMISVGIWIVALLPQIFQNFKSKSVEGMSLMFLLSWLVGDITNLAGSVLTQQVSTTIWLGVWYCVADVALWAQQLWYSKSCKRRRGVLAKEEEEEEEGGMGLRASLNQSPSYQLMDSPINSGKNKTLLLALFAGVALVGSTAFLPSASSAQLAVHSSAGRVLEGYLPRSEAGSRCNFSPEVDESTQTIGIVLSWISALLYFFSRFPQIIKNQQMKNMEDISIYLFIQSFLGNGTYGMAMILRTKELDSHFYLSVLPFLIGSMGTMVLDVIIIGQYRKYGPGARAKRTPEQRGIDADEMLLA